MSLGETTYLEIIGPDPEQDLPDSPRPFGLDDLGTGGLVTWAIHPTNLEGVVARAREAGGLVPFLIDWGETPNPALSSAGGCELVDLRGQHPKPDDVVGVLATLEVSLDVSIAPRPALIALLKTPNGEIELR